MRQPDGQSKADSKSRMERYQDEGKTPPMVELSAGQYLLEALMKAGPSIPGAMGGDLPLSWREIHGFMLATGAIDEPWEAEALNSMSRAYCSGKEIGKSPFAIYPGFD